MSEEVTLEEVESALEQLVQKGLVVKSTNDDGETVYRLVDEISETTEESQ